MNTKNKYFSILGDSVSTLEGYNPVGYNIFYQGDICKKADIFSPSDTWWGMLIDYLGGKLLVNNSWSGSRVTKLPYYPKLFPSAISEERTFGLHKNGVMPDIIIVNMGINDWAFGAPVKKCRKNELYVFESAYALMLNKLRKNYPNTEIWCVGIHPTYISTNSLFEFTERINGVSYKAFNDIIGKCSMYSNCKYIDLGKFSNSPHDTIDGTHPNKKGMKELADTIYGFLMC